MKERAIGVVLVLAGTFLFFLCVYEPLAAAHRGAFKVSTSLKGAILAPMGLVGLIYLVLGPGATKLMGTREEPTAAAYVIGVVAILLGVGLYLWVRSSLQASGYDFDGRF